MSEAQQTDALKKLVIFIIVLAVVATIVALVLYFAIDLPAQQAAFHPPLNGHFFRPGPWPGEGG